MVFTSTNDVIQNTRAYARRTLNFFESISFAMLYKLQTGLGLQPLHYVITCQQW